MMTLSWKRRNLSALVFLINLTTKVDLIRIECLFLKLGVNKKASFHIYVFNGTNDFACPGDINIMLEFIYYLSLPLSFCSFFEERLAIVGAPIKM